MKEQTRERLSREAACLEKEREIIESLIRDRWGVSPDDARQYFPNDEEAQELCRRLDQVERSLTGLTAAAGGRLDAPGSASCPELDEKYGWT